MSRAPTENHARYRINVLDDPRQACFDGKVEAVKLVDWIARVVGERDVGDLFGGSVASSER